MTRVNVDQHRQHAAFRSEAGEWFVYLSGFPSHGELLFSPDGRAFRALAVLGFGGSTREHGITFVDPSPDDHGRVSEPRRLELAGDVVICDGRRYERRDPPAIDVLIPLPRVRRCEYLFFRFEDDGLLLHVGSDEYGDSYYDSFRLSIGNGPNMRVLPIRNVDRYRDGGTTYIATDEGVLYSPTPFRECEHARWLAELPQGRHLRDAVIPRGRVLLPVDPRRFEVIDDPDRVVVTLRGG